MTGVLAQEAGALHSRTIEKRMAAAKNAKANLLLLIVSIMARESLGVRGKTFYHRGHGGSQGTTLPGTLLRTE